MRRVEQLRQAWYGAGLGQLIRAEKAARFYGQRRRFSPPWLFYQCVRGAAWMRFHLCVSEFKLCININGIPRMMAGEALSAFVEDMAFNLAPQAEVYRDADPLVEEAIAVIEAVARVPQQVNKWGHKPVMKAWPNLYQFYFGIVMPALRVSVDKPLPVQQNSHLRRMVISLRRLLRPHPGYYPETVSK
jgi:hypothetical protein